MNLREAVLAGVEPTERFGWQIVERRGDGFALRRGRMTAIISAAVAADGRRWVHLSIARPERLPTWDEFRQAKEQLLGDVEAYQVLPPAARYVNIHPHVLHLFTCAAEPAGVLPPFERDGRL